MTFAPSRRRKISLCGRPPCRRIYADSTCHFSAAARARTNADEIFLGVLFKVQPQVPFALLGVDENRATRSGGRPAIYGKDKRVWDAECGILGCRIQRQRYF